jgi:hypothetical protein
MEALTLTAFGEARRLGHHWVGVEHLLLALTKEPPGSWVREALDACDVNEADVAAVLAESEIPARPADQPDGISFTPRYYGVQGRAEGLALADGTSEPRPEHVLLAIVWSGGGHLTRIGVTAGALQDALGRLGMTVPAFEPPAPTEFGEEFDVSETELPVLLTRLEPLLSPPEITVAVRREGDRAWVSASRGIDVGAQIDQMRAER